MKLCVLVLNGVNEQGQKKLLAISDGVRESTQRWHELLLDLKERSFNAPKVVLGVGAVGLWAALDEVYLQTLQQQFWVHKSPTCSTRDRNLCSRTRRMICTRSGW